MSEDPRRLTVDEIELNANNERVAVLVADDGTEMVVPLSVLPTGTRTGDVLTMSLAPDSDETERRRKRVANLQKKLFGDH
jgi:hypothetical protein